SSPRHLQLLLALQTTSATVKDVMITICKGCHDNEHTEGHPYNHLCGSLLENFVHRNNNDVLRPDVDLVPLD
ncbi:MAG: hypothetical protein QOD75_1353, partial [Blastocatellia bacterium]|nr:hypothetical protein [Blastocatellia bacterium]